MKLLLAGGGTGGHLFPAVALAQQLLEEEWQAEVLFVGTERGIEARVLPGLGLPLKTIDISGYVGRGWRARLALPGQLLRSVRQSLRILDRFRPDVVVGVGGYASGPVLLAARLRRIPFIIHEQNALFGLTNRILARWAQRVCLSFPIDGVVGDEVVITGNPVRRGMAQCPPLPDDGPSLLVFGGSRGASAINSAMCAALPALDDMRDELQIIHQTGSEDCEKVQAVYAAAGWRAEVVPFIDDMVAALSRAQLVLCRAGATTVAELTAAGRAAILVPYPHAAADHQTANARAVAAAGAAVLLPQAQLTADGLAAQLRTLLHDRPTLLKMAARARALGNPEATVRLLAECRRVAGKDI